MNNDPWTGIPSPTASQAVNAKRVDVDLKWDFFWAKDVDSHCLLMLTYGNESQPGGHLPKVKGIELSTVATPDSDRQMLLFCLADSAQKDIFYKLCQDIVAASSGADNEKEAVALAVRRTWRWHHLLRGGTDGRLSSGEQKGLIGELLVLERYVLQATSVADAMTAWRSPFRAPKDFELGSVCIEAKARRGPAKPFVTINSEYQLDTDGMDTLFLHVVALDRASSERRDGSTITDFAQKVLDTVVQEDEAQQDAYETLLAAAGFRWEDDYTEFKWLEGQSHIYEVSAGFPRITANDLCTGIGDVKYAISLQECGPFEIEPGVLKAALDRRPS